MFKWFKEDPKTAADVKLKAITDILFPPLALCVDIEGRKYHVDSSADANLEAALIDLEDGHNDRVTQKTVRSVADKLFEVRKLLESYNEISGEAEYYVVDDMVDELENTITSTDQALDH